MKIDKQELLDSLAVVKPGLANKEDIDQATSFAFMNGRVITYNDEISISAPVTGLDIEGAIKADELFQLLGKIKKDEIDVELTDSELILTAGKASAGLRLQSEVVLPLEEIGEIEKWKELPKDFLKALIFAGASCGNDMNRIMLTCVHVCENFTEGSDGHRISQYVMESEIPIDEFLIPAKHIRELIAINPVKIASGEGWIHFKSDEDTILSCRVFDEDFPDTIPHLEVEGKELTLPKTMSDILERASVFSKREAAFDELVTVSLKKNRMKIKAHSDSGWFEEEVNIRYDDEPIVFFVTPDLIKLILKETHDCILGTDKLKFEGDNWTYMTILRDND